MTPKNIAGFSSAIVALAIAFLSAYISLRQDVYARPTEEQVRQLIDDKTTDKFFEVFRRFDRLDKRLDDLNTDLVKRERQRN